MAAPGSYPPKKPTGLDEALHWMVTHPKTTNAMFIGGGLLFIFLFIVIMTFILA